MAGNSSALTERSFGVPDGINNGQFGAGPVIDFFGLSSKFSNFPVEFVYPETTAIVPANIALISGAKNTGEGRVTARETNKVSLYVDTIGELHIPVNGEAPEDDVLAARRLHLPYPRHKYAYCQRPPPVSPKVIQ